MALWVAQSVLAYLYGISGIALTSQPILSLVMLGAYFAMDAPEVVIRLVGVFQVLGAIGIVVPALTRVLPGLSTFAALGLSVLQSMAILWLAWRGELGSPAPLNVILLFLSLFVLWGRTVKAPIRPRTARRRGATQPHPDRAALVDLERRRDGDGEARRVQLKHIL